MPEIKKIQNVQRIVHYYLLKIDFKDDYEREEDSFNTNTQAFLSNIIKLVKKKNQNRYQRIGEKILFINEINFEAKNNINTVTGKLLCIRKDIFPEILDTGTDIIRDIDANEEDGIVETTHFMIKEMTPNDNGESKLCLEYNQFGAKIADFQYYLLALGKNTKIVDELNFEPIIRHSLANIRDRIGEISKIKVRLQNDNLDAINNLSQGVFTGISQVSNAFLEKAMTLEFKYDLRAARENPIQQDAVRAKTIVRDLINSLINKRTELEKYEELEVIAEDSNKNDRLNSFDLLIDKVKDNFTVQKKEKSKIVVSLDMYEKMETSWKKLKV